MSIAVENIASIALKRAMSVKQKASDLSTYELARSVAEIQSDLEVMIELLALIAHPLITVTAPDVEDRD